MITPTTILSLAHTLAPPLRIEAIDIEITWTEGDLAYSTRVDIQHRDETGEMEEWRALARASALKDDLSMIAHGLDGVTGVLVSAGDATITIEYDTFPPREVMT